MKHPSEISILDFSYDLPQEKIAAFPSQEREGSKLLIYKNKRISESRFKNIHEVLEPNSTLIFNETKVIEARLIFKNKSNQSIEIFCLSPFSSNQSPNLAMQSTSKVLWRCLVGNLKKWKEEELQLSQGNITLTTKIVAKNIEEVVIEFSWLPPELQLLEVIEKLGQIPIPPYLKRESTALDQVRYQTVYSQTKGSVASPTAGLHFTNEILNELKQLQHQFIHVTLHVGAGTFKPVKSDTMQGHVMHSEWLEISLQSIEKIKAELNGQLICVGTTSLRVIESLYWMGLKAFYQPTIKQREIEIGQWDAYNLQLDEISAEASLDALMTWMKKNELQNLNCMTQILIAPPYQLKIAKGIITNFHQPQSTLLLLVAAVVGKDWKNIYDYALSHDFRFLSYGDSSILLK